MRHVQEKNAYWVLVGNPETKTHLRDLSVDGRSMLSGSLKNSCKDVDGNSNWRGLVSTVMKFRVQYDVRFLDQLSNY